MFIVGKNQAAITAHAAVNAKQSKALDVLINRSMREASEGKATFKDIEENTFIRFCQFTYTGDYTTPDFTHVPTIELPEISPPVAISYGASTTDREDIKSIEPVPDSWPDPPAPIDDIDFEGSTNQKAKTPKNPKKQSKGSLLHNHSTISSIVQRQFVQCWQRNTKYVRTLIPRRITLQFSLAMHSYTSLRINGV